MTKSSTARINMVDRQIGTTGVNDPRILGVFSNVPRESFVPKGKENTAYMDDDLVFERGRFLLAPMTHARMVQAVEPKEEDLVLDISNSNGYSAAILSPLVSMVVCVEEDDDMLANVSSHWEVQDVCNVAAFKGRLVKGAQDHAPYSIIFVAGSVAEIPQDLLDQLAPGGRLIAIVRPTEGVAGEVTLVQCLENAQGEKEFSSCVLFEASAPYLPGFEPPPAFKF